MQADPQGPQGDPAGDFDTPFVLVFNGEYDLSCKAALRGDLERLANAPRAVLDFDRVTFLDSTAIAELIRLHKLRAENRFERETIVTRNESVLKLFRLLELTKVFEIVPSLGEALRGHEDPRFFHASPGAGSR